jgi:esterase/lipase superfamily enzyme
MEVYYTDGCTYGCTETLPLVCDSPELALIQLEELIKSSFRADVFDFYGHSFDADTFYNESGNVELPNIYTVDEWFAQRGAT